MTMKALMPWTTRMPSRAGNGDPLFLFQRDFNRVFDDLLRDFARGNAPLPAFIANTPRTDVAETETAIEVSVELPGLEEKDVEVSVADDVLTIRGEKKTETDDSKKGYRLAERSYGSFLRSIGLPSGIATDKAEASFKNGVLTVTLPKTPEASPKKIEIKSS
ncbi:MAG: Hsp20/alpha crystallin family protein [Alphaproteobacteria bacterium]